MTDPAVRQLPPLPSLRALTAELRELHSAWTHPDAGGEYVGLTRLYDSDILGHRWQVRAVWSGDSEGFPQFGREWVPGSVTRECLRCKGAGRVEEDYGPVDCHVCDCHGRVHVPEAFDATAVARRLLAAARDAGHR